MGALLQIESEATAQGLCIKIFYPKWDQFGEVIEYADRVITIWDGKFTVCERVTK